MIVASATAAQFQRSVTLIPFVGVPNPFPERVARSSVGSATRESATLCPTVAESPQTVSGV